MRYNNAVFYFFKRITAIKLLLTQMNKLLLQFDTDNAPAVFDAVVAYDGGADHVIGYAQLNPDNVKPLVEGAIFTRAPKEKKNTAIFVGGSDMLAGQALFDAVQCCFFSNFRVSVMLDSNGSNTTAATTVATLAKRGSLQGKKAIILAGTGPVGQRAGVMLAKEGANVTLVSRHIESAEIACLSMQEQFDVDLTPASATDSDARGGIIQDANIVLATGATGVELLRSEHWEMNSNLQMLADTNATPPVGIKGIGSLDKGIDRHGKIVWGAIGLGGLKLALHRTCIARLFEDNKQILDAELIYKLAKQMA